MALLKMSFFPDSYVSSVLKSSCIAYTLRLSARRFLALTKNKSIFKSTIKTFGLVNFLTLMLFNSPIQAFDISNGKALHDENCFACHNESQYTRQDRIVTNYEKLRARVMQCELMLELAWFDEEVDDVTAYLNQAFYKFNPKK